jgi:tetratricopeptide (TPR) repeat protein
MGFFMRHFERQADLYSAVIMRTPILTISSLEKIALLTGKIRELPSWHHFSIKERVNYLRLLLRDHGLVKKHNRFVGFSFGLYLLCVLGFALLLNATPLKHELSFYLMGEALERQLSKSPRDVELQIGAAMLFYELEKYPQAIEAYERALLIDKNRSAALNNLAWLLVTVPNKELRDKERALSLAQMAVSMEKSPIYLDTLAETYHANGMSEEAVETIREAISMVDEGVDYYEKQLQRFLKATPED